LVAELVGGLGIGKETSKQMIQASGFGAAVGGMSDDLRKRLVELGRAPSR
jgi:hypothetical protein